MLGLAYLLAFPGTLFLLLTLRKLGKLGQLEMSVGSVVTLIVLIAVGGLVTYQITGALKGESGSFQENVRSNIESKGYTAFNLLSILVIVLVAAVIIMVVLRALGGAGGGEAPAV